MCNLNGKSVFVIDAAQTAISDAAAQIARFVEQRSIRRLNVAGQRASGWPQAHRYAEATVRAMRA